MDEKRKHRKFFAIDSHKIYETTGYEIPNERVWWCPELGYSMWIGKHLFDTYEDAKKELLYQIDCLLSELNKIKRELS